MVDETFGWYNNNESTDDNSVYPHGFVMGWTEIGRLKQKILMDTMNVFGANCTYNAIGANWVGISSFVEVHSNNIESSWNGLSLGFTEHLGLTISNNSIKISLGGGIGFPISPSISADTILKK